MAAPSYLLSVGYVVVLVVMFNAVVRWSRRRQHDDATAGRYFPEHESRSLYLALSEMYSPDDPNGYEVLTTALLERTVEDVRRLMRIREDKPAVQLLVQRGTVGQEIQQELVLAERELQLELNDVREEAGIFNPIWPDTILSQADLFFNMKRTGAKH